MFTSIELLAGFTVNLLIALFIVRFIYYPAKQNKNYVFTFVAFNTVIFFVMAIMTSIELSLGAGLGLFAVFSVLRYRTTAMSARDLTYLFTMIGLPIINAGLLVGANWEAVVIANVAITTVLYLLEKGWGFHHEQSQRITYERLKLLKQGNEILLMEDLQKRTGFDITRYEVGHVNFRKGEAEIKIFYEERTADVRSKEEAPSLTQPAPEAVKA